jgi:hypothetical protein
MISKLPPCLNVVVFGVIPWCLNFICRRFGTMCLLHIHRLWPYITYENGTDVLTL